MEYLVENGRVYRAGKTKTGAFKICHSMEYLISLEYANSIVTATYQDYLGNTQDNYNGNIIFELDGVEVIKAAVNGVASVDFIATAGTYDISAQVVGIASGRLVITIEG